MEFKWDAIHDALRAKVIDPRCPTCQQSTRWDGGNAIIKLPVVAVRPTNGKPLDPDKEPSVLAIMVSCAHCGLIQQFDLDGLMA
jgi:hypothetical protein